MLKHREHSLELKREHSLELKREHSLELKREPDKAPAPFALQLGGSLAEVKIRYDTYGELNSTRSNVVVVLHALTGWSAAQEWWGDLIGEGKLLDPKDYFIVCPNFVGSCYGSTGPESVNPATGLPYAGSFPELTIRDIAFFNNLLLDALDLQEVKLSIGGSMGAMVLLEMAAACPGRYKAIISIAASGSHSAWRIAFSSCVRKIIQEFDPTLTDRAKLQQGMRIARQIAMTSYRSSDEFESRFGRERAEDGLFEVERYLEHQGEKIVDRFSPYSYLRLTQAMEHHDLSEGNTGQTKAVQSITSAALFVGIDSDILYPESEIQQFASLFPNGEYRTLSARHGHDSFLVDTLELCEVIRPFLSRISKHSSPEQRISLAPLPVGSTIDSTLANTRETLAL